MVTKDPYAQAGSRLYELPSDIRYPESTTGGGGGGSTVEAVGELQWLVDGSGNNAQGYYTLDENGLNPVFVPVYEDAGFDINTATPTSPPQARTETLPACFSINTFYHTTTFDLSLYTDLYIYQDRILTPNNPRPTATLTNAEYLQLRVAGVNQTIASTEPSVAILESELRDGIAVWVATYPTIAPYLKLIDIDVQIDDGADTASITTVVTGANYNVLYSYNEDGVNTAFEQAQTVTSAQEIIHGFLEVTYVGTTEISRRKLDAELNAIDPASVQVDCDTQVAIEIYNGTIPLNTTDQFIGNAVSGLGNFNSFDFYVETGSAKVSYDNGATFVAILNASSLSISLGASTPTELDSLVIEALEDGTTLQVIGEYSL